MLESRNDTDNILEEIIPNAFTFKMVKVEGGTFKMGDNSPTTKVEKTLHKVTVPDFYISPYTVTNAEFAIFLNDYGSDTILNSEYEGKKMVYENEWGVKKRGKNWYATKGFEQHPIINVTWYGANEYCNWLSQKTEQSYRLPSELEWEFAAKGGNKSLGFQYAGSHKLKEVGWFRKNSYNETKPVRLKLPNELGLYDMNGNVWEWCADNWQENIEKVPKDGSALILDKDDIRRVIRGGAWYSDNNDCRVSSRGQEGADDRYDEIGFRFARY